MKKRKKDEEGNFWANWLFAYVNSVSDLIAFNIGRIRDAIKRRKVSLDDVHDKLIDLY